MAEFRVTIIIGDDEIPDTMDPEELIEALLGIDYNGDVTFQVVDSEGALHDMYPALDHVELVQ